MPTALDNPWQDGNDPNLLPRSIRQAFRELEDDFEVRKLGGGLLHQSFHVRAGSVEYVLQRVSDVFAPEIHDNIHLITEHLRSRDLPSFRLLTTRAGAYTAGSPAEGSWRLLTHLGGISLERLSSTDQARSAGALVGRFHTALMDFEGPLAPLGIPYRDTPRYIEALRSALSRHPEHRLHSEIAPLAAKIFEAFDSLGPAPTRPAVPNRVLHGDLKLSNLLFDEASLEAFALVDLDTLMWGPLWMDMGDAWRSWCNVSREDDSEASFDLQIFEASALGFFDAWGARMSSAELESLVDAPERLALEVCTRFATDSLEEDYFGWDASSYPAAGEHHAAHARGQWRFFEQAHACRAERSSILSMAAKQVRRDA